MAERTLPFVNVAMWSGGYYSTATKGCKDVIDGATPLVLNAIHHLPETDPVRPFTMTDMGCADGGTSLEMVRQAVRAVRARWPQRPSPSSTPTNRAMITTACSTSSTA